MDQLNPAIIALVGVLAMIIVYILQVVAAKSGKKVSKEVVAGVCFVTSTVLAYFFMRPELPQETDPSVMIQNVLTVAGAVMGFATLVYNALFSQVLDKLDKKPETFLPSQNPTEPVE